MTVTPARLQEFNRILQRYRAGKHATEQRVISAESWWRLRNRSEEERSGIRPRAGFVSCSGWLHNVISSKHADAMDNYPTPLILPREEGDSRQAELLAAVIPCVLEQNHFEAVYSEVAWQKLKTGTGCYRIVWDKTRNGGLGDIAVERANLLNLYWEPGIEDIQKSRYFFDVELLERETLEELYPGFPPTEGGSAFRPAQFRQEDGTPGGDRLAVIGVYYRKNGLLHYCRYTGETVLESTEDDPSLATRGLYDHGLYPFVFDPLYPIEGSPCGYGYVDVCRNPQTEIDLLRTAMVENALAGATPRHFLRADGAVNEQEYLDLSKPLVHVTGNLGEDSIRLIPHTPLEGTYITLLEETVNELRETSNNTETSTGNISGNVTAASAITALQEASGKTGRDATRGSYRCYCRIVELCIELIRQFYEVPRCFRITGARGREEFIRYGNAGIVPQPQGDAFGMELGFRLPVFDIRVEAAKKAGYTTQAQNDLALRLYQLGLLNPANAPAAIPCLDLMDFEGKAALLRTLEAADPMGNLLPPAVLPPSAEPENLKRTKQSL